MAYLHEISEGNMPFAEFYGLQDGSIFQHEIFIREGNQKLKSEITTSI